jgi:hypothetical protein
MLNWAYRLHGVYRLMFCLEIIELRYGIPTEFFGTSNSMQYNMVANTLNVVSIAPSFAT